MQLPGNRRNLGDAAGSCWEPVRTETGAYPNMRSAGSYTPGLWREAGSCICDQFLKTRSYVNKGGRGEAKVCNPTSCHEKGEVLLFCFLLAQHTLTESSLCLAHQSHPWWTKNANSLEVTHASTCRQTCLEPRLPLFNHSLTHSLTQSANIYWALTAYNVPVSVLNTQVSKRERWGHCFHGAYNFAGGQGGKKSKAKTNTKQDNVTGWEVPPLEWAVWGRSLKNERVAEWDRAAALGLVALGWLSSPSWPQFLENRIGVVLTAGLCADATE